MLAWVAKAKQVRSGSAFATFGIFGIFAALRIGGEVDGVLALASTTIGSMNEAPFSRRRWLRFSLRELLLLMLAVAGFVAWGGLLYETHQPFRASEFYLENMDW